MTAQDAPKEDPEDKDLQDHRFGMTAAKEQEAAEKGKGAPGKERTEPHAGGRA